MDFFLPTVLDKNQGGCELRESRKMNFYLLSIKKGEVLKLCIRLENGHILRVLILLKQEVKRGNEILKSGGSIIYHLFHVSYPKTYRSPCPLHFEEHGLNNSVKPPKKREEMTMIKGD